MAVQISQLEFEGTVLSKHHGGCSQRNATRQDMIASLGKSDVLEIADMQREEQMIKRFTNAETRKNNGFTDPHFSVALILQTTGPYLRS
jgi:chorismate mutase